MKMTLIAIALFAAAGVGSAKVELGPVIVDNMVLSQNTDARLYGRAAPRKKVSVTPSWNGKTYTTTADKSGNWNLTVETPALNHYKKSHYHFSDYQKNDNGILPSWKRVCKLGTYKLIYEMVSIILLA